MLLFKEVMVFHPHGVSSLCVKFCCWSAQYLLDNVQFFYILEGTVSGFIFQYLELL